MKENPEEKGAAVRPCRRPVQRRGIDTKDKILNSALELFCEKGYYKTSTNEIAQRARVSIGCLYAYFRDKETIFFEITEKYHEKFLAEAAAIAKNRALLKTDPKAWLIALIEGLIRVHEESRELNRELSVLRFYDARVARILEKYQAETRRFTVGYLIGLKEGLQPEDAAAAEAVAFELIGGTVDRIIFGCGDMDRERLIAVAADMICKYFFE